MKKVNRKRKKQKGKIEARREFIFVGHRHYNNPQNHFLWQIFLPTWQTRAKAM